MEGCCEVEVTMQAYDELVERFALLHRVSARDKVQIRGQY
jgi:hypothetical protein